MLVVRSFLLPILLSGVATLVTPVQISAQTPEVALIRESIRRGCRFLEASQQSHGGYPADGLLTHPVGVTCWATLALFNSEMSGRSPATDRAIHFLRSLPPHEPARTSEIALLILVLTACREESDAPRLTVLTQQLIARQTAEGGWTSGLDGATVEPSLTHLALLALRDAEASGLTVPPIVWERARGFWQQGQHVDGSWGLRDSDPLLQPPEINTVSRAATTLAAVSALSLCQQQLARTTLLQGNGPPDCPPPQPDDPAIRRGLNWLHQQSAGTTSTPPWKGALYRLYGLERSAGWRGPVLGDERELYWKGAAELLQQQDAATGAWHGNEDVIATSHALLFLARGLESVMVGHVRHSGSPAEPHPGSMDSLLRRISGSPGWPRLMTACDVDLSAAPSGNTKTVRLPAPVLLLTGTTVPAFTENEVSRLRMYLEDGGLLLAVAACQSIEFEQGLQRLLQQVLPPGEGRLGPLAAEHPVYQQPHALDPQRWELQGVEIGCRTVVIYCPDDLCGWWSLQMTARPASQREHCEQATHVGINILAYATGRESVALLSPRRGETAPAEGRDERLFHLVQVQHGGGWNMAPRALPHLIQALNVAAGTMVSPRVLALRLDDERIFQHPFLYLHGNRGFTLTAQEREGLKQHLERGGVLFATAGCHSPTFDRSLRELVAQLFPRQPLERIPAQHELFTTRVGFDLSAIRRNEQTTDDSPTPLRETADDREPTGPLLEGVRIDGRYALIYSQADISCALDGHVANHCASYPPEAATQVAINIVLYSLLQDLPLPSEAAR